MPFSVGLSIVRTVAVNIKPIAKTAAKKWLILFFFSGLSFWLMVI
jgi:hypothetical protein